MKLHDLFLCERASAAQRAETLLRQLNRVGAFVKSGSQFAGEQDTAQQTYARLKTLAQQEVARLRAEGQHSIAAWLEDALAGDAEAHYAPGENNTEADRRAADAAAVERARSTMVSKPAPKFAQGALVKARNGTTGRVAAIDNNHGVWRYRVNGQQFNEPMLQAVSAQRAYT
jgi:hypothetical protein